MLQVGPIRVGGGCVGAEAIIDVDEAAGPANWMPWYGEHPRTAATLAILLFVLVTAGHFLVDGTGEAVDILYCLPVALLAVTFGLRGGLAGACLGIGLFGVAEAIDGTGDIDATGWLTRSAGLLLLGLLLGRATDQIAASQRMALAAREERRAIQETSRRQAEALEISDSILQYLAAAKWMVEQGKSEDAIAVLSSTLEKGQRMVAEMLPPQHMNTNTPAEMSNASGS